jgi:FMN phosphatase YigB (HAD superfamily)
MATAKPDQAAQSSVADIQALIFDVYGTVVDWRAGVLEAVLALEPPAGDAGRRAQL